MSGGIHTPWMLIGDFNAYISPQEKMGGSNPNWSSTRRFVDYVNKCQLLNMGFQGPSITWKSGRIKERLDKGLCNLTWRLRYQEALITHLPPFSLDHSSILL